jgi:hypothetical protein
MRKLQVFLLVAVAILFTAPASAQVKLGIKGGIDATSLKLNESVFDESNRVGFYVGPTLKFTLPLVGLGVDASALYDQRSANVENSSDDSKTSLDQKQIAIPINLRYSVGLGSLANFFVFAGPQFGFNVGGDKKISDYDWKWKDSNFSVNLGVGITLVNHLQLNANYNIACGKTGDATWNSASETVSKSVTNKNFHARYNAWQIGLAYYF